MKGEYVKDEWSFHFCHPPVRGERILSNPTIEALQFEEDECGEVAI